MRLASLRVVLFLDVDGIELGSDTPRNIRRLLTESLHVFYELVPLLSSSPRLLTESLHVFSELVPLLSSSLRFLTEPLHVFSELVSLVHEPFRLLSDNAQFIS